MTGVQTCALPILFRVLGLSLFNHQDTTSDEFFDRLVNYYSEPNLNKLYRDALAKYETVERIERDLGRAFGYLQEQFPERQIPVVYMHLSLARRCASLSRAVRLWTLIAGAWPRFAVRCRLP